MIELVAIAMISSFAIGFVAAEVLDIWLESRRDNHE